MIRKNRRIFVASAANYNSTIKEKEKLIATYQSLNPAELKRTIDKKLDNLYEIYKDKKGQENINSTNKLIPSLLSFSTMAQKDNFGVMIK